MKYLKKKITEYINPASCVSSRKDFLRRLFSVAGASILFRGIPAVAAETGEKLYPRKKRLAEASCDLAVVSGESPAAITGKAIEALGGMGRFVRRGDIVVIKPNIGFNSPPEYAATTNPEVVAELVRLCAAAGAKEVRVFDYSANDGAKSYETSGIREAVQRAGGKIYNVDEKKFIPGAFPAGSGLEEWPIYRDAVECDCFINVPVAKTHVFTKLTLSMKNLMGICGGNRSMIHMNMGKKLAEITKFISPDLTFIDAYRIMYRQGPMGMSLRNVKTTKTVIAGADPVLADSYAATLFGLDPLDIGSIRAGEKMGIGTTAIAKANIKKITI